MRTLKFLLQKEFRQIFRNPAILRIIFMAPILQMLIIPMAADYEVKNVNVAVADHDHSLYSQQLIQKISAAKYFKLVNYSNSYQQAEQYIENDKADIILEIPQHFEKDIVKNDESNLFLSVNAVNGMKASLGAAYLQNIIQDFNQFIRLKIIQIPKIPPQSVIQTTYTNRFNPFLNYKIFMTPGVLVTLLTMVGSFLTALNIVKEKEVGTIEQINVTPVHKYYFILGKLIPFWILGLAVLTVGLLIIRFVYNVHPAGNIFVLYVFAAVYLLAVLGLGFLVSTFADTQQQAMLISFFLLMIFILLGGLFTPIDSMPDWVKKITWLNPISYFIEVVRMVILKGSGLRDIKNYIFIMLIFAVALNGWAVLSYKKRS